MAQPESAGRKYVSPYRRHQGERTRAALVEAALSFTREGNFRPEAREVAERAGRHPSAVVRHFGSIDLLNRVIAREHAQAIVDAAGGAAGFFTADRLAWLIMVGRRREMS